MLILMMNLDGYNQYDNFSQLSESPLLWIYYYYSSFNTFLLLRSRQTNYYQQYHGTEEVYGISSIEPEWHF